MKKANIPDDIKKAAEKLKIRVPVSERIGTSYSEFVEKYGDILCANHTGKMYGMHSISTSSKKNGYCTRRCEAMEKSGNTNCICSHCFANRIQETYSALESKLIRNTEILTTKIIPVNEWFTVSRSIFRLESFGDLNTGNAGIVQFTNYCNLCRANPQTTFTIWTKNPLVMERTFANGISKPENLIIIYSSPILNKRNEKILVRFPFVDHIFTVWNDEKTANENGVKINCGRRSCATCMRCYTKGTETFIDELLK